jgi:hypothetical protein
MPGGSDVLIVEVICSSNHKDYDQSLVGEALATVREGTKGEGIKYCRRINAAHGWLRSRPASESEV